MVCVLTLYEAYFYTERHEIDNFPDKFDCLENYLIQQVYS